MLYAHVRYARSKNILAGIRRVWSGVDKLVDLATPHLYVYLLIHNYTGQSLGTVVMGGFDPEAVVKFTV